MTSSLRCGALLWAAALPLCLGCSDKKLTVEHLELDEASVREIPDLGWSAETARSELESQLKRAHFVVLAEGKSGPERALRLRLKLASPEPDEDAEQAVAEVAAELQLRFKSEPESRELVATERRTISQGGAGQVPPSLQGVAPEGQGAEERREAFVGAAKSAIEKVALEAHALAQALSETDAALVKQLDSRSLADKHAAMRVLAERKNRAAVGPLLEQLKLDDPDLVHQAIGGLVEVGDPKAVPGLIEASRAKDDVFQREIVFALGALGGDEAEAYLFTVAQGTENPLLRGSAQQALKELRDREHKDAGVGG